jgi:hypothetical protein
MPFKDKTKNDAAKRSWDERNKERIAERKKHRYWQNVDTVRADRSERHWRFSMWEVARMSKEIREMHCMTTLQLINPEFVFIYQGKRHHEFLNEPLPQWRGNDGNA